MKETLKPGIKYQHKFVLPPTKTVPSLYPEAEEFLAMPEVFATGYMVGFLEWACIKAVIPHIELVLGFAIIPESITFLFWFLAEFRSKH